MINTNGNNLLCANVVRVSDTCNNEIGSDAHPIFFFFLTLRSIEGWDFFFLVKSLETFFGALEHEPFETKFN